MFMIGKMLGHSHTALAEARLPGFGGILAVLGEEPLNIIITGGYFYA